MGKSLRKSLGPLIAVVLLAADAIAGSRGIPPSFRGFGKRKRKADKKTWNQNLGRARSKSKRGGNRPVSRGR